MNDRIDEPGDASPTVDPEPSGLDWAGEAPRAEAFADEIVARRLTRPSRHVLELLRALVPVAGVLVALIVRASAESVGVGPEAAVALAGAVVVSAFVLTAAVHLRYFREP